jgi:hypothetical protein
MDTVKSKVLDPSGLFPDEFVMWQTAEAMPTVPSSYVWELLFRLQEARNEIEQIKTGNDFSVGHDG